MRFSHVEVTKALAVRRFFFGVRRSQFYVEDCDVPEMLSELHVKAS
jgi:hypothetical protein